MIKSILVSLNSEKFVISNLVAACAIAKRYDSRIIGLYVIPAMVTSSALAGKGHKQTTEQSSFYKSRAEKLRKIFEGIVQKEGVAHEWCEIVSKRRFIYNSVIEFGRESDLIIVGHQAPDPSHKQKTDIEFNENVVTHSGRPVIVMPTNTGIDFNLKKVVIGWDGSREAARAAFDAIPLLKLAENVCITCVNPHEEFAGSLDKPGSELATALRLHNIAISFASLKTGGSVARALLEHTANSSLLVTGAHGHSQAHEIIFGGVTNDLLRKTTRPIFMSS